MSNDRGQENHPGGGGSSAESMTPELIERLRRGDSGAGALLDRLYRDALIRFCRGYLGRVDEAEDAVQDICCRVLIARAVPTSFRPWLYKTARNHCLNLLRSRRRRPDGGELPAASRIDAALTGNLTRLVRHEQHALVADLVERLPQAQQEALRLRYVEGLSRGEIAEVLEIPESLVKSRLFEGIQRLRRQAQLLEDS